MLGPRARIAVSAALAAAFAIQFTLLGAVARPLHVTGAWLLAALASLLLATAALATAHRRGPRLMIALAWSSALAFEALYFERYHLTFDAQAAACAVRTWADIRSAVVEAAPRWVGLALIGGAIEFAILSGVSGARGVAFSRRSRKRIAVVCGGAALALGAVGRERMPEFDLAAAALASRKPPMSIALSNISIPIATSPRAKLPNTLFVLTESVRASDYCTDPHSPCPIAPRTHALTPTRIPLSFMRSVGSYTSIALSGLYTGLHQVRPRSEILEAPTLFDLFNAVRSVRGTALRTAYLSAHLKDYMMGRELSAHVVARLEELTGDPDGTLPATAKHGGDGLLVERFLRELPTLGDEHFVMLHFAGTHVRYFINPDDAPFEPWVDYVSRGKMLELHNKYKNAIHEQDKRIAEAVSAWTTAQGDNPYLIVFTSDHGEAFDEHEGIHHGQSLHAEQAHVPAWIASGNGALSDDAIAALRDYAAAPVTHLDLVPTLLDAYGVYDSLALATFRAHLDGRSLLRSREPMRLIPISNCPEWFECPIANWGVQKEEFILVANFWSERWNCASVLTRDEHLESSACVSLVGASKTFYPTLPNRTPN